MKTEKEPKLPLQCRIDNFLWSCSWIYNVIFIPLFIWNITKGNRSDKRIVWPTILSYFLVKDTVSAVTVEHNALWLNTIPTHSLSLEWRFEGDILGLEVTILVPETQAFIADVRLRQWANELGFVVTSVPQTQGNITSTKYESKMYRSKGIQAKSKSVDMAVGRALWGSNIRTRKTNYTNPPKEKKVKLGKTYS